MRMYYYNMEDNDLKYGAHNTHINDDEKKRIRIIISTRFT